VSDARYALAARLGEIAPADREWLLGQLSAQERQRVSDMMSALDPDPQAEAVTTAPGVERAAPDSRVLDNSASQVVARASAWMVAQALGEEPDWIVGLLVARRPWPWARDYVDGMEPERVARLQVLARSVDQHAKAAVFDAAVEGLARTLERLAPELVGRNAFDETVARLMGLRRAGDLGS